MRDVLHARDDAEADGADRDADRIEETADGAARDATRARNAYIR